MLMSEEAGTGAGSETRVLIVDDSTVIRQRIRAMVHALDHVTVVGEAGDGEAGLEAVREIQPDVVILDIMMPGPSGLDVLQQIKAQPDPPAVIVLTNYPYSAFRQRSTALGAEHFLVKSTEFDRIRGILTGMRNGHVGVE